MTEQEEYRTFLNTLVVDLMTDYKFSEKVAQKIVNKADIDYHWSCSDAVKQNAYELAEFVDGILDCLK